MTDFFKSDDISELAKALVMAQMEMENASKSSSNPYFKSKYADLTSVREASMEILNKYGLSILQPMGEGDDKIRVFTILLHVSGQYIGGVLSMKPVKDGPQEIGSLITYFRRYSWQAIIGLSADDDDGEKAMGRKKKESAPEPPTAPPTATSPLTKAQAKTLFKIGESLEEPFSQGEVTQIIDWYCNENGKTFESGQEMIKNFNDISALFLKWHKEQQSFEGSIPEIPVGEDIPV